MKLQFLYLGSDYCPKKETVIAKATQYMAHLIKLPTKIEIEMSPMSLSVYGQMTLDPRFPNRVRLNSNLSSKEIIIPLVHELIHLHQIHTKQLSMLRDGTIVWLGRKYSLRSTQNLSYNDYCQLPWEMDVSDKQKILLEKVLDYDKKA
jgi:hypothetical protein